MLRYETVHGEPEKQKQKKYIGREEYCLNFVYPAGTNRIEFVCNFLFTMMDNVGIMQTNICSRYGGDGEWERHISLERSTKSISQYR